MAFSLRRQIPESGDDGRVAVLLASLSRAAESAAAALGPRPEALRGIVDALSTGSALPAPDSVRRRPPLVLALDALRAGLFAAPGRHLEARLLWREAVATAWLSAAIARLAGGSPGSAGLAGLLHRAGEALALRAVAAVEAAEPLRFDAASVQAACTTLEPELAAALARAWRLPPLVGATLQGWRRVGEVPSPPSEARAVHFGHAFASQVLFAEFPSPGLAEAAAAGLRLDRREIARLRALFGPLKLAVESLSAQAPPRR